MSIRGKHAKRVVAPLTDGRRLTLAVWGITAALWLIGGFNAANRDTYDVMTALLPAPPASDDVVVVAIDAPSFAEIGLPWPWPRRLHARLVEAAHDAGAAVVAFDIVFDTPTPADGNFAEAIGHHGAVVLAAERAVTETPHATIETQSLPVAELVAAGARAGFAEMPLDPDGRARRLPAGADSFPRQVLAA